ncbi:ABC transporter ATP-binding protein [Clostridium oryzae]|uniref:Oligopeptide transport ATP-binding protein OppD n=1 Tax=Clostridium oryzae TaxID=1450648 RepID=A0A1V4I969_9CLOT|nr:ABC transporter ATP-binding protein [Clostridium oryzae]OPJ56541.1 oligopeptide transport ATP-binding protein OppD [Clostridium oryzae]
MENILEVNNLCTSFYTYAGEVKAVRDVSFSLKKGDALGIVGESGSGKSVTMMSIMRLLSDNGKITDGTITFSGTNITNLKKSELKAIRGDRIGMIFQDPMTSLNPLLTIGRQLMEPLVVHRKISKAEAENKAIEMLKLVGIPEPERRLKQYPHEFSGGMRQRVMIATALICEPELVIADEPTTALDVTIQAQILELLKDIKEKMNTSIIMITHDLGIVADLCDMINVMYGGTIVERGTKRDIFYNSRHPYTWGLLRSVPNPKNLIKERLKPIEGQPPNLLNPPKGCPFAARCDYAMGVCLEKKPQGFEISDTQVSACWLNHPDAPRIENPLLGRKNNE